MPHNSERTAAVHINLIVVPTRVSSSEVEIKSHQITIVDRVFAAHRSGCDIDDTRVFLRPRQTCPWTHNRIPTIADGPGVKISCIGGNEWIGLSRHPFQFVSTEKDQSAIWVVMSLDKYAIPCRGCRTLLAQR